MDWLKQKIATEGRVIGTDIIKVDSFLNHQVDPATMMAIGEEFARRFADLGITKVLTVEASGIAAAFTTALVMQVPLVFAKKGRGAAQPEGVYSTIVHSYTRRTHFPVTVSHLYLSHRDRVLIVDDFLATGEAALGLVELCRQAEARLCGIGIIVEKGFQEGGQRLRQIGVPVESLAVIERITPDGMVFAAAAARTP